MSFTFRQQKWLYYVEQIVNEFKSFFKNAGHSLAENILPISTSYMEYLMSFNDAINEFDLTTAEFESTFKSLKRIKAAGIDTINSNIVLCNKAFFVIRIHACII